MVSRRGCWRILYFRLAIWEVSREITVGVMAEMLTRFPRPCESRAFGMLGADYNVGGPAAGRQFEAWTPPDRLAKNPGEYDWRVGA